MGGRRCQNFYRFQKVTKEGKGFGADALGHTGTLCGGACCQNFEKKSKRSLDVSTTGTEKCHSRGTCFQKEKKVKESKIRNGNISKNGKWLEKDRLVSPETYTRLCKGGTYRKFFN